MVANMSRRSELDFGKYRNGFLLQLKKGVLRQRARSHQYPFDVLQAREVHL
jgi:hypothetical protein